MRTVRELQDAGAAGIFLEDQVWPKKCGHMAGKRVVPAEEQSAKLRAAVEARGERDCSSSRAPTPASRSGSRRRSSAASPTARPAPTRCSSRRRSRSRSSSASRRRFPAPLVANMIERGVTPHLSRDGAARAGLRTDRLPARRPVRRRPRGQRRARRAARPGHDRRGGRPDARLRRVPCARRPRRAVRRRGAVRLDRLSPADRRGEEAGAPGGRRAG